MKRIILLFTILVFSFSIALAGGKEKEEKATTAPKEVKKAPEKSTVEFITQLPEYEARYRAVWKEFMKKYPNIEVKITTLNAQDYAAQLPARLAGGTAPDIFQTGGGSQHFGPTKDNYKQYLNIKDIYKYWDKLPGGKEGFERDSKIELGKNVDGIYGLVWEMNFWWSTMYHEDMAKEAGVADKFSVKTMDDFWNWMDGLKAYVKAKGLVSAMDMGTGSCGGWCTAQQYFPYFTQSHFETYDAIEDLYQGKAKLTDPGYDTFFNIHKKLLNGGYVPEEWWTRDWEQDMEANFIANKVITMFHGPWMWDKVRDATPDAQVTGFPLPTETGKNRKILVPPLTPSNYTWGAPANEVDREAFKNGAFQTAFNYYCGPESARIQAEDWGQEIILKIDPAPKVNSWQWEQVGQYVGVSGPWEDVEFDYNAYGKSSLPNLVPGETDPLMGTYLIDILVKVLKNQMSTEEALSTMQKQLEKAFTTLPK